MTKKKVAFLTVFVAGVASVLYLVSIFNFRYKPNRVIVRNSANVPLRMIHLVVLKRMGTQVLTRDVNVLAPGGSFVLPSNLGDVSIKLTFKIGEANKEYQYEEDVDFWYGEGWLLDVQQDGEIQDSYDYPVPPHDPKLARGGIGRGKNLSELSGPNDPKRKSFKMAKE